MDIAVILPAAGLGRRFNGGEGSSRSKIEADIAGRPVFLRAIEIFRHRSEVTQVLLAANPEHLEAFKLRHGDRLGFHGVKVIAGGTRERWETVMLALKQVDPSCTHVAVHDAARPLVSPKLLDRVFEAAASHPAVVPALAVPNTLKRVSEEDLPVAGADPADAILGGAGRAVQSVRRVVETVDRRGLVEVQTPQVFEKGLLERAYAQVESGELDAAGITDDASLVEALGEPVVTVEGDVMNLKVTRPADLEVARLIAGSRDRRSAAELGRKRLFGED
jgi:2-C-methyl-D-erythritol 4-phosphate cytidylyltransferase